MDLEKAKEEFIKYASKYDSRRTGIKLKKLHSLRVMELSEMIAKSLKLSKQQIELATLIGLLHDIARFEQWKIYNTFSDTLSKDHGDWGVEILEENDFIRNFIEEDKYDDIIKFAIRNHNKYAIEEETDEEKILQAKIIRDADKIDILYEAANEIFWKNKEDRKKVEKSYISDENMEGFRNMKQLYKNDDGTPLDGLILTLAIMFDINFEWSKEYIIKEDFVEKTLNRFDFKNEKAIKQIEEIKQITKKYHDKK